jgi:DNA-binding transcriptional regulator YhcF (GntR family)
MDHLSLVDFFALQNFFQKNKLPIYSQINYLIKNEYIREFSLQKLKLPIYSQINCLIKNGHIREFSLQKKPYILPNNLPN